MDEKQRSETMLKSVNKSDQQRHTSETAETMADVRHEVDRIDRILVSLLEERQSFMDAAARIKGARKAVLDRWFSSSRKHAARLDSNVPRSL